MDIAKFHRTCPVHPTHKPWLVVQGRAGEFFIDHAHPFGVACASSNSSMAANCAIDIFRAVGIYPVPKYEDDLKVFRLPVAEGPYSDAGYFYSYDKAEMLRRIAPLDIPWHKEKGDDAFMFITTFIGFLWDLPKKTVSLPEVKRQKFSAASANSLIGLWTSAASFSMSRRYMDHYAISAFVYMDGRSHLASLSNFAAQFPVDKPYALRYPPHSVITDLKWWLSTLSTPGVVRQLHPRGATQDLSLFVDASTSWGIGIVMGDEWAAFRLADTWKIPGRDICWLETVQLSCSSTSSRPVVLHDVRLLIHSDKQRHDWRPRQRSELQSLHQRFGWPHLCGPPSFIHHS